MMTDNLRIASYNVRKARGLDQRRRPERTLQVINALNADIVVLQEADMRLGVRKPALPREMIEQNTDFQVVDVGDNGVSLGWHGNAVLVRDHIAVSGINRMTLPGLEPRGAVRIDLAFGAGLSVVATHLGLRRRDRQAQLAIIADAVADQPRAIIAGDFNEWSPHRGLEPLQTRFQVHAPGKTFHTRRPMAALDRFAFGGEVELRDAGVEQGQLAKQSIGSFANLVRHTGARAAKTPLADRTISEFVARPLQLTLLGHWSKKLLFGPLRDKQFRNLRTSGWSRAAILRG